MIIERKLVDGMWDAGHVAGSSYFLHFSHWSWPLKRLCMTPVAMLGHRFSGTDKGYLSSHKDMSCFTQLRYISLFLVRCHTSGP